MSERTWVSLWRLLPGLLFYNLIGRHIFYWHIRRQWPADDTIPKPAWISLADIRWATKSRS